MPIPGEFMSTSRRVAVAISRLSMDSCDLMADPGDPGLDGALSLWIGAVGPFDITTLRRHGKILRARFSQPIDPRIVNHFLGR